MKSNGWIPEEVECNACNSFMKIENYTRETNEKTYRCQNGECRKRRSLLSETKMNSPKIKLKDYLTAVYCFIMNMHNYQAVDIADIDEKTYIKIKKMIYPLLELDLESNHELLGSPTNPVQVDETAICRGRIIENPSSTHDDMPNITWLVGIIEEGTNRLIMKIVPNRSRETMKELFLRHISQGTIVKTDGHRSYPSAVEEINGI
jgi:transposase-like protein